MTDPLSPLCLSAATRPRAPRFSPLVLTVLLISSISCADPAVLDLEGRTPPGVRPAIEEAYRLAAANPALYDRIPCFCGCEAYDHKSVARCFVKRRTAGGAVAEWDYHGAHCSLCVDVVRLAAKMHAEGTPVAKIRATLEARFRHTGKTTPTPVN